MSPLGQVVGWIAVKLVEVVCREGGEVGGKVGGEVGGRCVQWSAVRSESGAGGEVGGRMGVGGWARQVRVGGEVVGNSTHDSEMC